MLHYLLFYLLYPQQIVFLKQAIAPCECVLIKRAEGDMHIVLSLNLFGGMTALELLDILLC